MLGWVGGWEERVGRVVEVEGETLCMVHKLVGSSGIRLTLRSAASDSGSTSHNSPSEIAASNAWREDPRVTYVWLRLEREFTD